MNKENKKLKVVLYFLLGLIFNFLGLILGSLWIKIKVKTNQKAKFLALLAGFGAFIAYSMIIIPFVVTPQIKNFLYSQHPELKKVQDMVEAKYPNGEMSLEANWNTSTQTQKTTSDLTILYESKEGLTEAQMLDMGKLTCQTLQSDNKTFDKVAIKNSKSSGIPLIGKVYLWKWNTFVRITGTCEEWITGNFK